MCNIQIEQEAQFLEKKAPKDMRSSIFQSMGLTMGPQGSIKKELSLMALSAEACDNLLDFWRNREKDLPILSQLAKSLLCIPASSAECERKFKSSSAIFAKNKSALHPITGEWQLLIKENFSKLKTYFQGQS